MGLICINVDPAGRSLIPPLGVKQNRFNMATGLTQGETTAQIEEYYSYFQTVKKDVVKPARIHHHDPSRLIYLSNLDFLHMYMEMLFAYRLSDTSDTLYNQFVLGLKQSLAKVLVSFYPAAGGLVGTCDMHHPVVIVCDDRGVPFIEAYKDEQMEEILKNHERVIPLSGLQAAGIVYNSFRHPPEIPESGIPCVIVQITRFKCGGVSVTVSWNHLLADMVGVMLLIKAWADIAGKGETTVVPDIDRTVLSPLRADKIGPKIEVESKIEEVQKVDVSLSSPANNMAQMGIVRMAGTKVLHISKEKIGMVKQAALDYGYVDVSTLDCICAHLWRSVTRHGNENAFMGTDFRSFATAVEGRGRLRGTLTSNYFGNVVVFASTRKIPTTEILSRPLAYTASLIRKAIQEITEETYWEAINKVEKGDDKLNDNYLNLVITSWMRYGMYDVDFGSGKPIHFQPERLQSIEPAINQAICYVLPRSPSVGGFHVVISAASDLLQRLWADPEFTSLS
ncbi:hypothetical protein R1sor_019642 [Riccia sorocarpa]|uniref:Uncharacterized protein n=1 Tax=Riccia sorocarpa TaxID=122646 RepID=A0ABD3IGQ6_9MARC